jgi:hypothetical protein
VLHHLTQREPQVFTVINRGLANDQIAKPLVVSEAATVMTYPGKVKVPARRECQEPREADVNRILGEAQVVGLGQWCQFTTTHNSSSAAPATARRPPADITNALRLLLIALPPCASAVALSAIILTIAADTAR